MSDDIVTRLRENAAHLLHIRYTSDAEEITQGADEIERLRAEINHLANLLWKFMQNTDESASATLSILHRAATKVAKKEQQ